MLQLLLEAEGRKTSQEDHHSACTFPLLCRSLDSLPFLPQVMGSLCLLLSQQISCSAVGPRDPEKRCQLPPCNYPGKAWLGKKGEARAPWRKKGGCWTLQLSPRATGSWRKVFLAFLNDRITDSAVSHLLRPTL